MGRLSRRALPSSLSQPCPSGLEHASLCTQAAQLNVVHAQLKNADGWPQTMLVVEIILLLLRLRRTLKNRHSMRFRMLQEILLGRRGMVISDFLHRYCS